MANRGSVSEGAGLLRGKHTMCKHRTIEGRSGPAVVRGFHPLRDEDLSEELAIRTGGVVQSSHLGQIHLAAEQAIRNNLGAVLHDRPRPTKAEAGADEFDGSVPFSQWLERDSRHGSR